MGKQENNKFSLPKILICAPQHESKMYAWDMWWENVKNFSYPSERMEVFLADNSKTKKNVKMFRDLGITAKHIPQNKKGIVMTIRDSHEACRQHAIKTNADFMLHLETDIIPPTDVITRLLSHRRAVVGGVYDLFSGSQRRSMIQIDENIDRYITDYRTPEFLKDEEPLFFNGDVNQVYHLGLGCVLIHRSVFASIPFRAEENADFHSDTWFANDSFQQNIPIFADTQLQCKHYNSSWFGKM